MARLLAPTPARLLATGTIAGATYLFFPVAQFIFTYLWAIAGVATVATAYTYRIPLAQFVKTLTAFPALLASLASFGKTFSNPSAFSADKSLFTQYQNMGEVHHFPVSQQSVTPLSDKLMDPTVEAGLAQAWQKARLAGNPGAESHAHDLESGLPGSESFKPELDSELKAKMEATWRAINSPAAVSVAPELLESSIPLHDEDGHADVSEVATPTTQVIDRPVAPINAENVVLLASNGLSPASHGAGLSAPSALLHEQHIKSAVIPVLEKAIPLSEAAVVIDIPVAPIKLANKGLVKDAESEMSEDESIFGPPAADGSEAVDGYDDIDRDADLADATDEDDDRDLEAADGSLVSGAEKPAETAVAADAEAERVEQEAEAKAAREAEEQAKREEKEKAEREAAEAKRKEEETRMAKEREAAEKQKRLDLEREKAEHEERMRKAEETLKALETARIAQRRAEYRRTGILRSSL